MADGAWVKTDRSRALSGRKSKDTAPEVRLRKALHAAGARFRLHRRLAKGCTPDLVLPGRRLAVFVDGDFWHGCFTDKFPPSRRKLEWQAQDTPRLWDTVMHFRPSGIRAKRPTYLPALVAITQTSIVGPRERRLSPRETARLQGLPDTYDFGAQRAAATYKQMGNGVNVGVVWHVLREHVRRDEEVLKKTAAGRQILRAVWSAPLSPDGILAEHVPAG